MSAQGEEIQPQRRHLGMRGSCNISIRLHILTKQQGYVACWQPAAISIQRTLIVLSSVRCVKRRAYAAQAGMFTLKQKVK
jgi:hypothetical protein